jgi:hypothetical protein
MWLWLHVRSCFHWIFLPTVKIRKLCLTYEAGVCCRTTLQAKNCVEKVDIPMQDNIDATVYHTQWRWQINGYFEPNDTWSCINIVANIQEIQPPTLCLSLLLLSTMLQALYHLDLKGTTHAGQSNFLKESPFSTPMYVVKHSTGSKSASNISIWEGQTLLQYKLCSSL